MPTTRHGVILLLTIALCGCGPTAADRSDATPQVQASASSAARISYSRYNYPVLTLPDGERQTIRSLLNVPRPMQFGDYLWNEDGVGPGPVWVRVDLARQLLSVFRDGHEIGSTVILFGADDKPTPLGVFPVLAKAEMHQSTLYEAEMPYMLRLTGDGVAIHASTVKAWAATHGCIGVPPAFAKKLFGVVQRGDRVAIIGPASSPKRAG